MRLTYTLAAVAKAIMANPGGQHWGYDLIQTTGVKSGVLYPVLARMHEVGWLTEQRSEPEAAGRPPRRSFELTDTGRAELDALLDRARDDPRFVNLFAGSSPPPRRAENFGLLRGVLMERVDDYRCRVARSGLPAARDELVPEIRNLVKSNPATAARLIAAALDLLAEQAGPVAN